MFNFWRKLTIKLFAVAVEAHNKTVRAAQKKIHNNTRAIRVLEYQKNRLENDNERLNDWLSANSNEKIIL